LNSLLSGKNVLAQTLKGRNSIAQGNALGKAIWYETSPERAKSEFDTAPFQGDGIELGVSLVVTNLFVM
jgi:hypothetical protein